MSNLPLPLWAKYSSFPARQHVQSPAKLHRSQRQRRSPFLALQVFCVAVVCGFGLVAFLSWQPHTFSCGDALAATGGDIPSARALALQKVCPTGSLVTNPPEQPLWKLHSSFLPAADFARLQRELLETRPLMQRHHFADGFNAVNIDFNREGWAQLEQAGDLEEEEDQALAPLIEFARPVRLPGANGWSLNVVYSQPRSVQRSGSSGPQDPHIDNLGLQNGASGRACTLASHQTSVLYLSVPQDMAGGNLTVWKEQGQNGQLGTPEGSIRPAENLLVSFRGNAPHRVEEFDSGSMRVSLTLEQYFVPEALYWALPSFEARRLRY